MDLYQIISAVLGLLVLIFGAQWLSVRSKIGQAAKLAMDFLAVTEDKTITPEEGQLLLTDILTLLGYEQVATKFKMKIRARMKK